MTTAVVVHEPAAAAVVEVPTVVTVAAQSGAVAVVVAPTVVEVATASSVVAVAAPGPQGPPGPAGAVGGAPYVYTRGTPAATWPINHALGRYPQVTVVDTSGNRRISDVVYADINNVSVIHSEPLLGSAYLS